MKIHNMMEESVMEKVNEIFHEEDQTHKKLFCTCHQCRLDVACYVLNRITPFYFVSGRGLAHLKTDYQDKLQREADLVTLIRNGIEQVSKHLRPHFCHDDEREERLPRGFFLNFPQIMGRVFNSVNFEPLTGINVALYHGNTLMKMANPNWPNPYTIPKKTPGVYSFWPYPENAENIDTQKQYELEIAVDDAGYEPLRHYFTVLLVSEEQFRTHIQVTKAVELEDLYLIPQ